MCWCYIYLLHNVLIRHGFLCISFALLYVCADTDSLHSDVWRWLQHFTQPYSIHVVFIHWKLEGHGYISARSKRSVDIKPFERLDHLCSSRAAQRSSRNTEDPDKQRLLGSRVQIVSRNSYWSLFSRFFFSCWVWSVFWSIRWLFCRRIFFFGELCWPYRAEEHLKFRRVWFR